MRPAGQRELRQDQRRVQRVGQRDQREGDSQLGHRTIVPRTPRRDEERAESQRAALDLASVSFRRVLAFAVAGLVLYAVAPAIAEVFGAWPHVRHIAPAWFAAMFVAQAGSLWCLAKLQALCMGISRTGPVLTSSLAAGALGRVLPGGSATAAATQYGMLTREGVDGTAIGVGLAAGTLVQLAALCALPLTALPSVALGLSVPTTLAKSAAVSAGLFVVLLALTALALRSDRALSAAGRAIDWVRRRLPRGEPDPRELPTRLIAQRDQVAGVLADRWRPALAVTTGRWLFDFLTLAAALAAIGAHGSLALTLLAYAATQLLGQIPVTPGGLGVVEAALTGSLVVAGTSTAQAALATLAYRLVSYWLVVLAGLVAWLVHRRRDRHASNPSKARS
jgi:uncharacterized protein (TIRG00374 family)